MVNIRLVFLFFITSLLISFSVYSQSKSSSLSGTYETNFGKFIVAVDRNKLTASYEFQGRYDAELKAYMQQFDFFIKGGSSDGKAFDVIATNWNFPEDMMKGKVVFDHQKMKIILEDTPSPGCGFDITKESDKSYFPMTAANNYLMLAYVKLKKAPLFDNDGQQFNQRKGYLIEGDFVKITEYKGDYSKIIFETTAGKLRTYWIKTADLIDPFVTNWKGFPRYPKKYIKLD